jgi:hypothetical protein
MQIDKCYVIQGGRGRVEGGVGEVVNSKPLTHLRLPPSTFPLTFAVDFQYSKIAYPS